MINQYFVVQLAAVVSYLEDHGCTIDRFRPKRGLRRDRTVLTYLAQHGVTDGTCRPPNYAEWLGLLGSLLHDLFASRLMKKRKCPPQPLLCQADHSSSRPIPFIGSFNQWPGNAIFPGQHENASSAIAILLHWFFCWKSPFMLPCVSIAS
jgi:hypothetical protein